MLHLVCTMLLDAIELRRLEKLGGLGVIEVLDLMAIIAGWSADSGGPVPPDEDGVIEGRDLLAILGAWD